jgi:hypothetical protein
LDVFAHSKWLHAGRKIRFFLEIGEESKRYLSTKNLMILRLAIVYCVYDDACQLPCIVYQPSIRGEWMPSFVKSDERRLFSSSNYLPL